MDERKMIYLDDAINAIWSHATNVLESSDYGVFFQDVYKMAHRHIVEVIKQLPSAEPERKRGRWIVYYECPKCGEITKDFTEYCPFCNADMIGRRTSCDEVVVDDEC